MVKSKLSWWHSILEAQRKRHVDELTPEEYSYLFDKALSSTGCEQWKNFRGDDDWELTCIAPMEYNTLLFYNGGFFILLGC